MDNQVMFSFEMGNPSSGINLSKFIYPVNDVGWKLRISDDTSLFEIGYDFIRVLFEGTEIRRSPHDRQAVNTRRIGGCPDSCGSSATESQQHHTSRIHVRSVNYSVQYNFQVSHPTHH